MAFFYVCKLSLGIKYKKTSYLLAMQSY